MQKSVRKLRLLPLLAGIYYMVAGGPQGLEDILGMAGYGRAILILVLLPFVWSLPTSLMIGELASSIPLEGGFYAWVRRALGPFWGFQEAWLSLAASIFDMAIYPTLFVEYISRIVPALGQGHWPLLLKLAVIACATLWNLRGAYAVGEGSVKMMFLGLSPFVALIIFALWHAARHQAPAFGGKPATYTLSGAILVAMWNYMGWDNASTIAGEVEQPQRNYPRAMLTAAFMTMATYTIPICVLWVAGLDPAGFTTGSWVDAGRFFGGPILAAAIAVAVSMDSLGNFTSLTMSYTRLPLAMAQDGLLPKPFARLNRHRVPWVAILFCATLWALALGLTFERLISVDLVLWGSSLLLEFAALVILRLREPHMIRPFKVPGGLVGAITLGLGPAVLIAFALWAARDEQAYGISAALFSVLIAAIGPLLYWVLARKRRNPDAPVVTSFTK
ncbi:APC family permease [Terriglobus tenax]|uniref:APC family permease n=1 Tax=Terriglobus tenax TaxID=1111115 RepID=UPI0021E06435|nr:APC family permease [Terriglobus tenax]